MKFYWRYPVASVKGAGPHNIERYKLDWSFLEKNISAANLLMLNEKKNKYYPTSIGHLGAFINAFSVSHNCQHRTYKICSMKKKKKENYALLFFLL